MLLILLLLGGGLILLAGLALVGPAGARSHKRRLDALKLRHAGSGNPVETQLRRIAAQRATKLDEAFQSLLPNPELLRRRLEATGKNWTLGRYASFCVGFSAVVCLLHGGFWRMPYGREELRAIAEDLRARGYAVWNIE